MGVAILSGVLSSLDARYSQLQLPVAHSSSGSSTPVQSYALGAADDALPTRFIACVHRKESVKRVVRVFTDTVGPSGAQIEVVVGDNVRAAQESDVVLLA